MALNKLKHKCKATIFITEENNFRFFLEIRWLLVEYWISKSGCSFNSFPIS